MWRSLRWAIAALLLVFAASIVLISNTTQHFHACSTITDTGNLPKPVTGLGQQTTVRLPVTACAPIYPWTIVPIGGLALILLLPDYAEVGFGGFGMKRLEQRIADQVDLVTREFEDIRTSIADATGVHKDVEAGMVLKGDIRNVELRLRTVQEILLRALLADPSQQTSALYSAGFEWGEGWSKDFVVIEGGVDVSTSEQIKSVLDDWSYYDATAGLGRIRFTLGDNGFPTSAEVRNGFLSIERDSADLRHLFAGYLAGSLDGLLASRRVSFDVQLTEKSVERDLFSISAVGKKTENS